MAVKVEEKIEGLKKIITYTQDLMTIKIDYSKDEEKVTIVTETADAVKTIVLEPGDKMQLTTTPYLNQNPEIIRTEMNFKDNRK